MWKLRVTVTDYVMQTWNHLQPRKMNAKSVENSSRISDERADWKKWLRYVHGPEYYASVSVFCPHTHKHIYSQSFSSSSREHLAFKLPPICLLHDTVIWPKYHFIHITWNRSWFEATVQCTHTYTMFRARWQTSLKCCGMTMCIPYIFCRLFSSVFLCVVRGWHVLFSLPLFPCFRAFAAFVLSLCHCNIMKTNIHEPRTHTAKRIYD